MLKLGFLLSLYCGLCALAAPEVRLGGATIIGRDIGGSNVDFFGGKAPLPTVYDHGIPFAEPPVGRLRFRSPVIKTRLDVQRFDASEYGNACLQPLAAEMPGIAPQSEDCLTINIHRPAGTKRGAKLPVLFWVFGGGFVIGGSNIYNGSEIVARSVDRGTPVIYANLNYRVGPFGYPAGREAQNRGELNLGLKDIITALKWVNENIDAFGGDKNKVTIFGESAGAANIAILYFNSGLEKLVRGVILESGFANTAAILEASDREATWQTWVRAVPSCSNIADSGNTFPCLQNASEVEISEAYSNAFSVPDPTTWGPTVDGPRGLLPDIPSRLLKDGKFAKIPFIAGTNLDEGTFSGRLASQPGANDDIVRAVLVGFSSPSLDQPRLINAIERMLELYPDIPALGSPYGTGEELFGLPSAYKRLSALVGDIGFDSRRRQWMEAATNKGVKGYGYLFIQPQPLDNPADGVEHFAEVAFVYGTPVDQSPSARRISTRMMDYWISFAVNLDPNDSRGSERPAWPHYSRSNKVLLQLHGDNTTTIPDNYRQQGIEFSIANSIAFRR
ncbi:triacylglycerol lipase 3 [Coprinopsis marcescibilis]|uniref:Carboxylic ester hydrolase n=1 Tax=Coprinopsis marcescibilis TaxID=230819 RepID=A0A5C3KXX5_COPMA|nr:triacylglycerol lipase 3 [Coprinopsis marcescibilis]